MARIAAGTEADVGAAVAAARAAFPPWAGPDTRHSVVVWWRPNISPKNAIDATGLEVAQLLQLSRRGNGCRPCDEAKTPGTARGAILRSMAAEILRRKPELCALETEDSGKPIEESEWDIDDAAACFEYFAERAEKLCDAGSGAPPPKEVALPDDAFAGMVVKEPLGVVGLITPWNYPLLMSVWKVAPVGRCI